MEIVTYFDKVFSLFISKDEINEILNKLALEVNETYQNVNEDVILVSILDGSFIFMADLVRKLDFEFDIEFVKIRSYEGMESSGDFELLLNLQIEIEGKHILIIEDIVDTGLTIEKFIDKIKEMNPASVKVCSLLSKPEVHNDIIDIDFVGREIPPAFVIGYGLDIDGKARNLDGIYQLET
jgi:hypoxanthine phosphoribosyltransferase